MSFLCSACTFTRTTMHVKEQSEARALWSNCQAQGQFGNFTSWRTKTGRSGSQSSCRYLPAILCDAQPKFIGWSSCRSQARRQADQHLAGKSTCIMLRTCCLQLYLSLFFFPFCGHTGMCKKANHCVATTESQHLFLFLYGLSSSPLDACCNPWIIDLSTLWKKKKLFIWLF
jgi:hypothetical protein